MPLRLAVAVVLAASCTREHPARLETYPVGTATLELVDDTRTTHANGDAPAHAGRKLTTELWYPAVADGLAADPERTTAPFPLVVFVHGSSGFRSQSAFLAKGLAAHGFVVAAADHPLTAFSTPGGSSDRDVQAQPGDVTFLASALFAQSASSGELLSGVLEAQWGYAVAGHSTGGAVSLAQAMRGDPAPAAAVVLAGDSCFFQPSFLGSREVPILLVSGTNDRVVPHLTNAVRSFGALRGTKRLATLVGGTHMFFTDFALADPSGSPTTIRDDLALSFADVGGADGCEPFPPAGSDPPMAIDEQHRLTVALVRHFLDATLGADPAGLDRLDSLAAQNLRIEH